ncbi:MAG: hypothetical protein KGJ60_15005 [Verrucomicrobiota bacterium]|nr:hypothetical protein [Verrucomicrobiota bacterium]
MPDAAPNPELLRSLGRLARGLSALFWGLPAALIIYAETARADWLKPPGILPALAANGLLLFGLWQLGDFQKQERSWLNALDRAKLLGLVNFGLCPFLYWQTNMPDQPFFNAAVWVLALSALLFLFNLNLVLKQLGAMLPDETLRQETRQFTALNRGLLAVLLLLAAGYVALLYSPPLRPAPDAASAWTAAFGVSPRMQAAFSLSLNWILRFGFWALTFFSLLPLAMTMALLWKTKEVILESVFDARR